MKEAGEQSICFQNHINYSKKTQVLEQLFNGFDDQNKDLNNEYGLFNIMSIHLFGADVKIGYAYSLVNPDINEEEYYAEFTLPY
ncbi:hypothetical protein J2Z40_002812 [Cytobacillus eiseniae]|uniref:Uncharacterized protein n=1 Tax=Cytobacillus eiseniae TaxID=762947 RepID=A0ABS4RH83_9BACI|nr:hypothetical protein [Cytobacillus eiseniae]MBP2242238.1 hypothetical protein [Cytobacillus eiseniae]